MYSGHDVRRETDLDKHSRDRDVKFSFERGVEEPVIRTKSLQQNIESVD